MFQPPPTRNAYVAMGQNWEEMSEWDRQVVRVHNIKVHTTAWDSQPGSDRTPCGRRSADVITGASPFVTCLICQRYNDGI